MSMTVTKADGVVVFTVTSNPKSKCPIFFQLLHTLCCSPFCFKSETLKQQLGNSHTVLGALQIMVGVLNVAFGGFARVRWSYMIYDSCFWIGAVFIAAGILCILVDRFPTPCLTCFSILVNLVSFGVGVTAIVFNSIMISQAIWYNNCELPRYSYDYGYRYRYESRYGETTTTAPTTTDQPEIVKNCEHYQYMFKMLYGGMLIMMTVLAVLLLCVTVSSCILSLKAMCKKTKENEMEDPELQKPLVQDFISSPAC